MLQRRAAPPITIMRLSDAAWPGVGSPFFEFTTRE
jgi:hypothetical protein